MFALIGGYNYLNFSTNALANGANFVLNEFEIVLLLGHNFHRPMGCQHARTLAIPAQIVLF